MKTLLIYANFFLLIVVGCRYRQIELLTDDSAHSRITKDTLFLTVEDLYIYNGTWKFEKNSVGEYTLKQMHESSEMYSYFLGWGNFKGGSPLDHPGDIGTVSDGMAGFPIIKTKDTIFLKKCLHAYLKYAAAKDSTNFK